MRLCLLKIANGPGYAESGLMIAICSFVPFNSFVLISAEDDETESILKVLHAHHRKVRFVGTVGCPMLLPSLTCSYQ